MVKVHGHNGKRRQGVFTAPLSLHLFDSTHKIAIGLACDLTVEWQPPFLGLQPLFAALCPVVLGLLR